MGKSWLYLGCSLQEYKATGQLCLSRLLSVYFRLEYKQGNNTSKTCDSQKYDFYHDGEKMSAANCTPNMI